MMITTKELQKKVLKNIVETGKLKGDLPSEVKTCLLHPDEKITAIALFIVDEKFKVEFHAEDDFVYGACSNCMSALAIDSIGQTDKAADEIKRRLKMQAH